MKGIATREPDPARPGTTRPRRPAEIEREWRETVYRGAGDTMPQLTARAILMGAFLGGVLSLTNLYVALKIGWTSGVAITACVLSFSIWRTLRATGLVRSDFGILENNCMQSTATAAGYSVGGTMASAIAAMLMITGRQMDFWTLLGWNVSLAVIGVAMAVPMKRQMINIEQLPFPSGTAAAETLRGLHGRGGGAHQGRALALAGLFGAAVAWLRDATFAFMPWNLPAALPFGPLTAGGLPLEFPTISLGEEFMKPSAMLYRNLMSMDVEETLRSNPIDGVVLLCNCDKTTPAQLMAAASADLPAIQLDKLVGLEFGKKPDNRFGGCSDNIGKLFAGKRYLKVVLLIDSEIVHEQQQDLGKPFPHCFLGDIGYKRVGFTKLMACKLKELK